MIPYNQKVILRSVSCIPRHSVFISWREDGYEAEIVRIVSALFKYYYDIILYVRSFVVFRYGLRDSLEFLGITDPEWRSGPIRSS
jgi:hypothetical protein